MKSTVAINAAKGFTLIEVMVTVFVMAVGILGVAGMQAIAVKESVSLVMRTEADFLIADIVDKMHANRRAARGSIPANNNHLYDSIDINPASSLPTEISCSPTPCDESGIANNDIARWGSALQNSSLPAVVGQVNLIGDTTNASGNVVGSVYQISIFWDEDRDGATGTGCDPNNASDMACARLVVQI